MNAPTLGTFLPPNGNSMATRGAPGASCAKPMTTRLKGLNVLECLERGVDLIAHVFPYITTLYLPWS